MLFNENEANIKTDDKTYGHNNKKSSDDREDVCVVVDRIVKIRISAIGRRHCRALEELGLHLGR
jgi:hypothetical protein